MKFQPSMTIDGRFSIEVIAENDFELSLLSQAWEFQGYRRGNGSTVTPKGSTGFYIDLCRVSKSEKQP